MSAPYSEVVDIARRSAAEVFSAVRRWTDAARPAAGSLAGAEPSDPQSFLNEYFDFFADVVLQQRDIAQWRLAAGTAGTGTGQQPSGVTAREHGRNVSAGGAEPITGPAVGGVPSVQGLPRAGFRQFAGVAPAGDDDRNRESAALSALAEGFATLVRALATTHEVIPMSPQRIIQLAFDCMPRVQHAALIAVQDGETRTVAATPSLPDRIDHIRSVTGQCPGLDVLHTNELVVSNDLAADPRWPLFGPRLVDELDLRSIVSYRLYLGRDRRAALSLYSEWPHAFDNVAITTGAILAAYCSLSTFNRLPHRPNGRSGGQDRPTDGDTEAPGGPS